MRRIGIQVFGEHELRDRIKAGKGHFSHCISIRNPGETLAPEIEAAFCEVLELEFFDEERAEDLPKHAAERRIPGPGDVDRIIDFVRRAAGDPKLTGFTVHCWRGISRSTAVALGLIYSILKDEERATKALMKIRPQSMPHTGIVRMFDKVLGSNLKPYRAKIHRYRLERMFIRLGMVEAGSDERECDYIDGLELFD